MVRKYLIIFVLAIYIIQCFGCTAWESNPSTMMQDERETQSDLAQLPVVSYPGNDLVPYDPNLELYVLFENVHMTMYLDNPALLYFYIFSHRPLDVEAISIDIPIEANYDVHIYDSPDYQQTEVSILQDGKNLGEMGSLNALPYYVFQCYAGVDFEQIGSTLRLAQQAENDRNSDADELWQRYYLLLNGEVSNFRNLQSDALPKFYVYSGYVFVSGNNTTSKDEIFTTVDVKIGDEVYHKEIGEVRIVPGEIPTHVPVSGLQYTAEFLKETFTYMIGTTQRPYSDGVGKEEILQFTAPQDMTLTGFHILDEFTQFLDLQLVIISPEKYAIDFYWDGISDIEVSEGSQISLVLYYRNPVMANLWYQVEMRAELDYAIGEEEQCILLGRNYVPIVLNIHELYALVFAGVDMESYYRDYYYPLYETWREKYQ